MRPFINLLDYFQRFRTLSMNRMVPPSVMERDSLTFWRVNVLFAILFTALVLCTLTIGAAIFLAIKEKVWGLVIFDILGYVICISLLLSRRLSYGIRAAVTLLMFYIVGLAVIASVGPLSGGPVWLFTFAVLVGVLLGSKAAMVAIAVNGITLTIIAWLLSTGQFGHTFPFFNTSQVMVSAGVNFIVLNVIAAMSVSVLVKGLVSSHQKEKVLLSSIEQERVHLMEAKKGLELEVEERKQAEKAFRESEAQLRRTQRMEAISTLAGGIAHDFNNILSAIMGYGQLAQMKLDPVSEVYADLKEVLQSGDRAKLLIQQILAIGRDQEQERQPIQLKYVLKEALKLLRSTLPSTIEIREAYEPDVGVIDADPTQMHQVIMNLCTNAGHAMQEEGGILTVSLRNAECGLRNVDLKLEESRLKIPYLKTGSSTSHEAAPSGLEPGHYLELTVSDTGFGMTREVMGKVFDPYFTTKEKGEGTGIGLSVVHGIVAQHGGAITVESEPGKGSAFHVYLRLTQAEEEQPSVKEETPLPKGNERILFIDDEAALARMGKEMLNHLGYDTTCMTGSIEALALFEEDPNQFDLVITDTTMPHMPGDILARELMKLRPDIPVIIFTGHSRRISPEKAKEMGIKGFLMKPLAMRDLAGTVRKALD